jgi:hypothetical protein
MANLMPGIGRMLRKKIYGVPDGKIINLVLDNVGDHGTKETIDGYEELLMS